jgi:hypothetical protein
MPTFLTAAEVTAMLQISRATLARMCDDGRISPPIKFGKLRTSPIRFDPETLKADIARLAAA